MKKLLVLLGMTGLLLLMDSCKKENIIKEKKLLIPTENAADVASWYRAKEVFMDHYWIPENEHYVLRGKLLAPSLEDGRIVIRIYNTDPTGTIPVELVNTYVLVLANPRNLDFKYFSLYDKETGEKVSDEGELNWWNETMIWNEEKYGSMTHFAMSDPDLSKFNPATPSPVSFNGTSWITEIVSQRKEHGIFYVTYRNSVTGESHKVEIKPEKFWPEKYSYFVGKVDGLDARIVLSTNMDYCGGSEGLAIKFYWDETTAPSKH